MLRPRTNTNPTNPNANARCQKCLQPGHWTFDCPNERVYRPRPTRSALLANPSLKLPEQTFTELDVEKTRAEVLEQVLGRTEENEEPSRERKDEPGSPLTKDDDLQDTEADPDNILDHLAKRERLGDKEDGKKLSIRHKDDGDSSSGFTSDSETGEWTEKIRTSHTKSSNTKR